MQSIGGGERMGAEKVKIYVWHQNEVQRKSGNRIVC